MKKIFKDLLLLILTVLVIFIVYFIYMKTKNKDKSSASNGVIPATETPITEGDKYRYNLNEIDQVRQGVVDSTAKDSLKPW